MTNPGSLSSSCVLCSPTPVPDEDLDLKPFLNPTDQDTQLILTLCQCLDFSIDFNFNCRPSPDENGNGNENDNDNEHQDQVEPMEFENHHDNIDQKIDHNKNKDNNNVDFDDTSSTCSSTATFSSPPSLFCRNCVDTLQKFKTLYKQMESLGIEMSQAVSKLIRIILSSKLKENVENFSMNMSIDNNNPILSHIEIMKQQICTRFSPSVNVKQMKKTALQNFNHKKQMNNLTNMRNDNGDEVEIVNEVQKRLFNEVQKQRPLLPKPTGSSPQKNRILLLPHPTEPTKLAVFIVKPVGSGTTNSNSNPNPNSTLKGNPNVNVNPLQIQVPTATETAEAVEPETDPLQLNEQDKNNKYNNYSYYDNEHMLSLSPPPVRELSWDKLVKSVGTCQYQYRNKWPFTAVPGTPGYDCCCGFRAKNKEGILIHLQKHVPFVHWKTVTSQIINANQTPNPIPKPSNSKSEAEPKIINVTLKPRPRVRPRFRVTVDSTGNKSESGPTIVNVPAKQNVRVTVDSTGNKFTYGGKWIFNKVPIYDPDTGEVTDPEKFQFQCEACGKLNVQRSSIITHIKNVHDDPQIFMCDKCPRQFNLKKKLEQHQMTHSNVILFMCSFCGKGYRCKSLLKNHELTHQDENEREKFPCTWENCKKIFFTKSGRRFHMKGHAGQKHQCEICGCVYNQKPALLTHMDTVHHKVIRFTCPVETCKKGFYSRTHYQRHMKSKWVHSGVSKKVWSIPKKYSQNKTETLEQQVEEEHAMDDEHENGQDPNPNAQPNPEPEQTQNQEENSDASESEYESDSE